MKKFFATTDDKVIACLRIVSGLLMLPFGLAKIGAVGEGTVQMTVEMMSGMGIPAFVAWLVIIAETVGAMSLIVGFCTRFCAGSLALIMAAAVVFTFPMGYMTGYITPLLFLTLYAPMIVRGAGSWSADEVIAKKVS